MNPNKQSHVGHDNDDSESNVELVEVIEHDNYEMKNVGRNYLLTMRSVANYEAINMKLLMKIKILVCDCDH